MNDDRCKQFPGRRKALVRMGAAAAALLPGALRAQDRPACMVRPQQTEGPYFIDTRLARSDIRADPSTGRVSAGVPLQLTFRVSRLASGGCGTVPDAHVELWQCDARGVYSGVRDPGFDAGGQQFLRGYQVTDAAGMVRFTTVYPGWYPGRAVHLHFMIRSGQSGGRADTFTSQLYFDDALSDRIFALPPYAGRRTRATRNAGDGIYRRGGPQLLLAVREHDQGLAATFDIALQSSA